MDPQILPTVGELKVEDALAHYRHLESLDIKPACLQMEHYRIRPESIQRFRDRSASPPVPAGAA